MDSSIFIEHLQNPNSWFEKAKSLRDSADAVWELSTTELRKNVNQETGEFEIGRNPIWWSILRNAQYFYCLSAECALKGIIIKKYPDQVIIDTQIDGAGNYVSAGLKKFGKETKDLHNLEKLADIVGIRPSTENPDKGDLLAFGTQIIKWIGRYPVPISTKENTKARGGLPSMAFGSFFRDYMDPYLDDLFNELEK